MTSITDGLVWFDDLAVQGPFGADAGGGSSVLEIPGGENYYELRELGPESGQFVILFTSQDDAEDVRGMLASGGVYTMYDDDLDWGNFSFVVARMGKGAAHPGVLSLTVSYIAHPSEGS